MSFFYDTKTYKNKIIFHDGKYFYDFLEYIISNNGLQMDLKKIKTIEN